MAPTAMQIVSWQRRGRVEIDNQDVEIADGRPGLRYRPGEAMLSPAGDPAQAGDALEQFELEFSANPNHASAAWRSGEIHYGRSQPERALRYYEQAVRLRPDFKEARLALGRLLLGTASGRPQSADNRSAGAP